MGIYFGPGTTKKSKSKQKVMRCFHLGDPFYSVLFKKALKVKMKEANVR